MKESNLENEKTKSIKKEEDMKDAYKTKIELTVEEILDLPRTITLRWPIVALCFYKKQGVDLSKTDLDTLTQRIVQDFGTKEETARLPATLLIKSARR